MSTPSNHPVSCAAPGDPTRAQKRVTSRAPPSSPPCSRAVPWSKHLFSPSDIPQLDGAESFSSEKELYIQSSTPTVAPQVQHECQCSQLPLSHRYNQPYPQPTHDLFHPRPPHKHHPNRSYQPQDWLAPLQPAYSPPIATLPMKNEPEPDQREPEPDQQEPEKEQLEP